MLLALPYEVWRDVKDYKGLYQVSNLGRVKSVKRYVKHYKGGVKSISERILKLTNDSYGYLVIHLSKNGVGKMYKVHRLVAEAFIPNQDNKPTVDHINTIKTDNRIENLRWATDTEQKKNELTKQHSSEAHKGEKTNFYGKYGKKHPNSKPVLQYDLDGNFIKEWECASQVQREINIISSNITSCCRGRYGFKTAGGYVWKYKVIQT